MGTRGELAETRGVAGLDAGVQGAVGAPRLARVDEPQVLLRARELLVLVKNRARAQVQLLNFLLE